MHKLNSCKNNASGVEIKIEIIMVHAQDHLMTTMTLLEVAKEMLALYKKVTKYVLLYKEGMIWIKKNDKRLNNNVERWL